MASPADGTGGVSPDDVLLTAWLDGELASEDRAAVDRRLAAEPALAARLEALVRADRSFGPAYETLLAAAPTERLNAMLAGVIARNAAGGRSGRFAGRRWMAVAAVLAVFAVGALAGYLAQALSPPPYKGWRQVVAEYHALISPETLAVIHEDPAALSAEMSAIGERLAIDLTVDGLALPDAMLKRVQLYDYWDRPLAQLVYFSADRGPFALCIIANGREDEKPEYEEREGSRIVYWSKGGHGYMLIAKSATRAQLEAYAAELEARFS